ncbi:ATP-binding cassette domain-containing protein [Dermabacteraceae bacterium TAE3-ERU5]|nr:ATP-binding cassette domain-containing protein [Dermabacteraceae bacterium TAE3-ERU5]
MPDAVLPTENGERLPYALEAEGLSLGFGAPPTDDSRPETRGKAVISDLTLRLEAGSYTVLVGPSGCGKTTLAQAICAVFTSAMNGWLRGSLTVDGTDLTALGPGEVARHVAFVWQQPDGQMCSRSVLGEASLPLDYLCVSAAEGDARAREALSRVGLSHLAETRDPLTLSGGEQQRLALAAAIVQGAKVLVLDEATSALDTSAQEQFRAALRQVCADRQLTVLAIDHRPENHTGLADRLLVLDASGRLVRDGDFNSLLGGDCAFLAELGIRVPGEDYAGATRPAVFPAKTDTPPVLTARELSYRLGRSGEPLLEPVSFTLHRGDLLYVYGENGAGKTTLLNCLAGAFSPGGNVGPALPQRIADGIAWVNQRSPQLQAGRNVAEEMARAASRGAVGTLAELSSAQREEVTGLLEALGLAETLEMSPLRLSGGMRQRLSFAAALVSHPALLLLDEPTSAQDARGTASILRLLADYRTDLACVLVTHDDAFARAAAPSQRLHLLRPENSEAGATTGSQKKGVKKTPQVPGRVSSLLHPLALLVCTVAVWAAAARRTSPPELALLIGVLLTIGLVSALRNRGIGIYLLQLLVGGRPVPSPG